MPGSARPWCGHMSVQTACQSVSGAVVPAGRPRRDRSPSRRLMTCSATSPREVLPALAGTAKASRGDCAPVRRVPRAQVVCSFPVGQPVPERRVLARGSWTRCGSFRASTPLVIAVDDAQWLDRPSASVLEFCFRRLQRRACLDPADLPRPDEPSPARPGPRPAAGPPGPRAAGPAEPGRYRRDPAVTAGGRVAPVHPHPAV